MKPIQVAKLMVVYDRRRRQWAVRDGERVLATFPRGRAGKAAAIREAIRHLDPGLYHRAQVVAIQAPSLKRPVWRAARGLLNGRLRPPRPEEQREGEVGRVVELDRPPNDTITEDGDGAYVIRWRGSLTCTCPGFRQAPETAGGRRYCAHTLMWLLTYVRAQK